MFTGMPGQRARQALAGTRFADVHWVAETGSTNADVLERGRHGEPEGVVLVADHQTAGRGRRGRTWEAPPGASLLFSVLLRPPSQAVGATTMAAAVAAAGAVEEVAGFAPRLKWPNDLVVTGPAPSTGGLVPENGTGPQLDRKLAGILAEADWPAGSAISDGWRQPGPEERGVVVVGIGLNVNWPADLPPELAEIAVAANHLAGHDIDREDLLVALLRRFDRCYGDLVSGGAAARSVFDEWRSRSVTLGRRVRVELGPDGVEGTAVDVTAEGHLVVETEAGDRRSFAAGDVVHLR